MINSKGSDHEKKTESSAIIIIQKKFLKKKAFEKLGNPEFDPGRIHFFVVLVSEGSYAHALYFDAVSIKSYLCFTNPNVRC